MLKMTIEAKNYEDLQKAVSNLYDSMFKENLSTVAVETQNSEQNVPKSVPPVPEIPSAPRVPDQQETSQQIQGQVEVDSRGLPWDSRIHSNTKNKKKDGTWRPKRGVDKNYLAQIEGELADKVLQDQQSASPVIPPAPVKTVDVPMPSAPEEQPAPTTSPSQQQSEQVVRPPVYENVQVPNGPTNAYTFGTFKANFGQAMANLVTLGKIDQNYIQELCDHYGINNIIHLMESEQSLRSLFDMFTQNGIIINLEQ